MSPTSTKVWKTARSSTCDAHLIGAKKKPGHEGPASRTGRLYVWETKDLQYVGGPELQAESPEEKPAVTAGNFVMLQRNIYKK